MKIIVKNIEHLEIDRQPEKVTKMLYAEGFDMVVSDGYHTIDELYEHRIVLFIALCRKIIQLGAIQDAQTVWRSKKHSDGSEYNGWFIMGINTEEGKQITYHLPNDRWDETNFVFNTFETAPGWDAHTSKDVVERLKTL